jgi:hypothetical protein
VLLDQTETSARLSRRDAFLVAMTPLDRALRTGDEHADEAAFVAFASAQACSFDAAQRERLTRSFAVIEERLKARDLVPPFPPQIHVGLTTGEEEGAEGRDLTYTRAGTIFVNGVAVAREDLTHALAHELLHVLTFEDHRLRDRLYGLLGFAPAGPIERSAAVERVRLTSPEAPVTEHVLSFAPHAGVQARWAFFWAANAAYHGGPLEAYLTPMWATLSEDGTATKLFSTSQIAGLEAHLARNTRYLGGPEEILADNFACLVEDRCPRNDAVFLEEIAEALRRHREDPEGS